MPLPENPIHTPVRGGGAPPGVPARFSRGARGFRPWGCGPVLTGRRGVPTPVFPAWFPRPAPPHGIPVEKNPLYCAHTREG